MMAWIIHFLCLMTGNSRLSPIEHEELVRANINLRSFNDELVVEIDQARAAVEEMRRSRDDAHRRMDQLTELIAENRRQRLRSMPMSVPPIESIEAARTVAQARASLEDHFRWSQRPRRQPRSFTGTEPEDL